MLNIVLPLLMLAGFALMIGALVMVWREGWSRKPVLMFVLAAIMFANVAIWAIPNERGVAPVSVAGEG